VFRDTWNDVQHEHEHYERLPGEMPLAIPRTPQEFVATFESHQLRPIKKRIEYIKLVTQNGETLWRL
jgi:hypothetical protein